ncbi:hypothetical protein HK405_003059, partial [Cladochytrium tenue]
MAHSFHLTGLLFQFKEKTNNREYDEHHEQSQFEKLDKPFPRVVSIGFGSPYFANKNLS